MGAELAATKLNAGDGILGKQVEVVPIDDAADPATGVKAAKAAIAAGLDGVVGPYNSGVGVETLPLYIKAGLVPIRLTSDQSTNGLGFTLQPMSYQIAPVASRALTEWQGAKSVAIAYDPTQNYTVSASKALKASLEKAGVTVTAYEKVQPGKKSYTDVVDKLAATEPDVIYAAVYFPEGGLIAKEMQQAKVKAQCVADYASYDTGFVETAGVAAARACPVVGVPAPQDFSAAPARVGEYEEEFGQKPGTWSPYTYDSLNFLADGVEEGGRHRPRQAHQSPRRGQGLEGLDRLGHDRPEQRQPPARHGGDRRHRQERTAPRRPGLGQSGRRPLRGLKRPGGRDVLEPGGHAYSPGQAGGRRAARSRASPFCSSVIAPGWPSPGQGVRIRSRRASDLAAIVWRSAGSNSKRWPGPAETASPAAVVTSTSPSTTTTLARSCTSCSCSSSPAGSRSTIVRASSAEASISGWCGSASTVLRSQLCIALFVVPGRAPGDQPPRHRRRRPRDRRDGRRDRRKPSDAQPQTLPDVRGPSRALLSEPPCALEITNCDFKSPNPRARTALRHGDRPNTIVCIGLTGRYLNHEACLLITLLHDRRF